MTLELTQHQIAAARTLGFTYFPANDDQVRRFTMQRRVFRMEGKPYLVSADGIYFETHSTLAAILDEQMAMSAVIETPEFMAPPMEGPAATAVTAPEDGRMEPVVATNAAQGENAADAAAAELSGDLAALIEPPVSAARRRRAPDSKLPRWMTAGKARRGRLK